MESYLRCRRRDLLCWLVLLALDRPAAVAGRPARSRVPSDPKPAIEILNVSYDPTRELYEEFNQAFAKHWAEGDRPEGRR